MGKLKNISNRFRSGFSDMRAFGVFVGVTNMLWPIIANSPKALKNVVMRRKKQIIDTLLLSTCSDIVQRFSLIDQTIAEVPHLSDAPIYVCWLQGKDCAPAIVQKCIASIQKHAGEHPVNIITGDNYSEYVALPEIVLQAWKNGRISNAHFADILRCALLCEHGGCWIDATIWMSGDIREEVFEYPIYSCRFADDGRYITKNKWSNFFLAAQPYSVTMHFVRDMLYEYMQHQTRFVDYFLMDYIIRWGYDHIDAIKQELDTIPFNNESIHELVKCLQEPMLSDEVKVILGQSYMHKLSWRIDVGALSDNSVGKTLLMA